MSGAVSVVIPNWNGRDWLGPCLAALGDQELAPAEVIVVDNGWHDGSLQYLRDAHPEVVTVALGANTGFAHAANLGLGRSSGEFVALVNADVEARPRLARTRGRRARSRPRRGGGRLQDGLAVGPESDLRRG